MQLGGPTMQFGGRRARTQAARPPARAVVPRAAVAKRRPLLVVVVVAAGASGTGSATPPPAAATASAPPQQQKQQQPAVAPPSALTSLAQILAGGPASTFSAAQQLLLREKPAAPAGPLVAAAAHTAAAATANATDADAGPPTPPRPPSPEPLDATRKIPFRGPPTTDTHPLPIRLGWAGSGLFFWWQLGAVAFLRDRYDLSKVRQVGASGGALAAALAACDACPDRTMDVALELSERYGVWERPLGLMGVWGRIVEEWLEALLPEDAHVLCSGRVGVVYTVLPTCEQVVVGTFSSKRDLIDCLLASAHVPFFLDFRPAKTVRGKLAVDGSLPDFFTEQNSAAVTAGGQALVFDYYSDERLVRGSRLDMLALREPDAIRHVMRLGYEYAHRLHEGESREADGSSLAATHGLGGGAAFSRFDWSGAALSPEEAARRSPGLPPRNVAVLGVPHGSPLPWVEQAGAAAAAAEASA